MDVCVLDAYFFHVINCFIIHFGFAHLFISSHTLGMRVHLQSSCKTFHRHKAKLKPKCPPQHSIDWSLLLFGFFAQNFDLSWTASMLLTKLAFVRYKKLFSKVFLSTQVLPPSRVIITWNKVSRGYRKKCINEVLSFYVICWQLQIYTFYHSDWRNKINLQKHCECFCNKKWWMKETLIEYKNIIISLNSQL